jgi:hypothetical protein
MYLVDGKPEGLRVIDRSGWTGVCLAFSRADYAEAKARPELGRTGVYVLVGPEVDGPRPQRVYVGEGDEVRTRLDSHHRDKDFWTHAYVLTTKDDSLNKAHVRYLESRLLELAATVDAAARENGTMPPRLALGEAEESDMENYLENSLVLLPLLGVTLFDVVDAVGVPPHPTDGLTGDGELAGGAVTYYLRAPHTEATGQNESRGFLVKEGALGRALTKTMNAGYELKRNRLRIEEILVPHGLEQLRLTRDYLFDSPSQAASVLTGGSKNGRDAWRDSRGRTLKQNQAVEAATS